jgi:hypothetical protein
MFNKAFLQEWCSFFFLYPFKGDFPHLTPKGMKAPMINLAQPGCHCTQ